jgi:hypothetical protein
MHYGNLAEHNSLAERHNRRAAPCIVAGKVPSVGNGEGVEATAKKFLNKNNSALDTGEGVQGGLLEAGRRSPLRISHRYKEHEEEVAVVHAIQSEENLVKIPPATATATGRHGTSTSTSPVSQHPSPCLLLMRTTPRARATAIETTLPATAATTAIGGAAGAGAVPGAGAARGIDQDLVALTMTPPGVKNAAPSSLMRAVKLAIVDAWGVKLTQDICYNIQPIMKKKHRSQLPPPPPRARRRARAARARAEHDVRPRRQRQWQRQWRRAR